MILFHVFILLLNSGDYLKLHKEFMCKFFLEVGNILFYIFRDCDYVMYRKKQAVWIDRDNRITMKKFSKVFFFFKIHLMFLLLLFKILTDFTILMIYRIN